MIQPDRDWYQLAGNVVNLANKVQQNKSGVQLAENTAKISDKMKDLAKKLAY
jgi:hypothetical protein